MTTEKSDPSAIGGDLGAATTRPGSIAPAAPTDDDVRLAAVVYAYLECLFAPHITTLMREAGQYIIDTFYGGNARRALVKNRAQDTPPGLKLLIEKLRASADDPSGNAPSLGWFYKAIRQAAHMRIFEQREGLSTFTILDSSHKQRPLNAPKTKHLTENQYNEVIAALFDGHEPGRK